MKFGKFAVSVIKIELFCDLFLFQNAKSNDCSTSISNSPLELGEVIKIYLVPPEENM